MSERAPAVARLVRFGEWWNHKLPPLLAVAYLLLGQQPVPLARSAGVLALFLATSVATAAFGHLLNDFADQHADRTAGIARGLHDLSPAGRRALLVVALAAALLPWLALPRDRWNVACFAAELALLAAYSLPPCRLKERGVGGVIADALYAHALPVAIAATTFRLVGGEHGAWYAAFAVTLVVWKLAQGLCGALVGQIRGRRADRRSGTRTLVSRLGPRRALGWVNRLLLPLQGAAFLAVCGVVAWRHPWFAPLYPAFLLWTAWKVRRLWRKPRSFLHRTYPGYILLNDFHELWMPLLWLIPALARDPAYAWVLGAHLLLFRSAPSRALRALAARFARARVR